MRARSSRSADGVGVGVQQRLDVAGLEVGQGLGHGMASAVRGGSLHLLHRLQGQSRPVREPGHADPPERPGDGCPPVVSEVLRAASSPCHARETVRHASQEVPMISLRLLFASAATALALAAGGAQAFTLHVVHFNDFHSRIESINAFEFDLLGGGRDGGRVLRRGRAAVTAVDGLRDEEGQGRERAVLDAGDDLPGVAVLHHLLRRGRGRDAEPRWASTPWSTATTSSTSGPSRWPSSSRRPISRDLGQRRRLRRQPPGAARADHLVLESAARRWRSSASSRPTPPRSPPPARR